MYVVGSATDTELTLRPTPGNLTGSALLTFTRNASGGDTITRVQPQPGGELVRRRLPGRPEHHDRRFDQQRGRYTIASISPDGVTLTLTQAAS